MANTIRFYHHPISGNAHRAELMLSLLELPFERIQVNLLEREQKQPAFLAKNPLGQVPVIEDGEHTITDSTAILVYLALRYDPSGSYLPREPAAAAHVQRWLSLASNELARGPARLRLAALFGAPVDRPQAEQVSHQLLGLMEAALTGAQWLVGATLTLADIAMYTYVAHAPEGGISLEAYPQVRAWLSRIEALPRFVGMQRAPALSPQQEH
jgi:glutathione S-transferase